MTIFRIIFLALLGLLAFLFLPYEWFHGIGIYSGDDVAIVALLGLIGLIGILVIGSGVWFLFLEPIYKRFQKQKSLAILFVIVFAGIMVTGCGVDEIKSIDANTLVTISRAVDFKADTALYIACNKATLNYEKRAVIIEDLVSVSGKCGNEKSWVIREMKIQNGNLVIYIPDDVCYKVSIGPYSIYFHSRHWKGGKIEEIK